MLRTSGRVYGLNPSVQNLVRADLQENPFFLPPKVSLLFLLLNFCFLSLSRSSKAKNATSRGGGGGGYQMHV